MWLAIVAALDKVLGIIGNLVPFWIKRSDESKKKREEAQKEMDDAKAKGDFEAWKSARHKRNSA